MPDETKPARRRYKQEVTELEAKVEALTRLNDFFSKQLRENHRLLLAAHERLRQCPHPDIPIVTYKTKRKP